MFALSSFADAFFVRGYQYLVVEMGYKLLTSCQYRFCSNIQLLQLIFNDILTISGDSYMMNGTKGKRFQVCTVTHYFFWSLSTTTSHILQQENGPQACQVYRI